MHLLEYGHPVQDKDDPVEEKERARALLLGEGAYCTGTIFVDICARAAPHCLESSAVMCFQYLLPSASYP